MIRTADANDTAAVQDLLEAAFPTAVEAGLVAALRAEGAMLCELIHGPEGAVTGYAAASAMRAPAGCAGLGPVAVAEAARGRGVAGALVRAALERLRAAGRKAVFVVGEPGFYSRFGFSAGAAAAFVSPYPPAFTMALELAPGGLAGQSGPLRYAQAFEGLD